MRAKFIYESLNFERGQDPKVSIGIGMEAELQNFVTENFPRGKTSYYLNYCAQKGRSDLIRYLIISKGYNPDTNDGAPLKLACSNGHYDAAKTLVDLGANPAHEDRPIFTAIINNNYDIAELLLERGAKMIQAWQNLLGEKALKYPLLSKYYKNKKS
jgi:ankyrin repeat protein